MTTNLAIHLIEQFASQAPFALWITDSRGVVIFANKKLHAMLEIADHPSKALGINLLEDVSVECLQLREVIRRARDGEVADLIVQIQAPDTLEPRALIRRKEPLALKISCYALLSSERKIEHYAIAMSDISETYDQRVKLRQHLRDLTIFNKSKEARLSRLAELQDEALKLEAQIRSAGGVPAEGTEAIEKEKAP